MRDLCKKKLKTGFHFFCWTLLKDLRKEEEGKRTRKVVEKLFFVQKVQTSQRNEGRIAKVV